MRWTVGTQNNGSTGQDVTFPWSLTLTARSGELATLRACNTCEEAEGVNVTVTTSIYWNGTLITTRSRDGEGRDDHCTPQSNVDATLP